MLLKYLSTNSPMNPVNSLSYSVINSRLSWLGARVPRRHYPNQKPSVLLLEHQRSPTIPLAGIPPPVTVPGAHHFVVDYYSDSFTPVPTFACPVVDHGHGNRLQCLRTQSGTGAQGAPSSSNSNLPQEVLAASWKANWGDVG